MFRFDKNKTFKPKKHYRKDTVRYDLHKKAKASLGAGASLQQAVRLPEGEDLNEWLAVHVVDFFNRVNLIYGTVAEFCEPATCPTMSAGRGYEYSWADGKQYKKPTEMPAQQYISLLMAWIEELISDQELFPSAPDVPFPKGFRDVCRKILKRLFRVFAHVYYHHFDRLQAIGAEAHVNTCYKHFYFFVTEHKMVDEKEMEPLKDLSARLCQLP